MLKPYLISRAPEIAAVLKSVDEHEDMGASVSQLISRGLSVHPDAVRSLAVDLRVICMFT